MTDRRAVGVLFLRNPALTQLLGLSPLLAIATSATLGAALGAVCAVTLLATAWILRAAVTRIAQPQRPLAAMLVAAAVVAMLDLALQLACPALRTALALYMPLVAGNCLILHALQAHATSLTRPTAPGTATADSDTPPGGTAEGVTAQASTAEGDTPGAVALGFAVLAAGFGTIREVVGTGALFGDLELLGVAHPGIRLLPEGFGLRLALLPPGAFFTLAALVALQRGLRRERPLPAKPDRFTDAERLAAASGPPGAADDGNDHR